MVDNQANKKKKKEQRLLHLLGLFYELQYKMGMTYHPSIYMICNCDLCRGMGEYAVIGQNHIYIGMFPLIFHIFMHIFDFFIKKMCEITCLLRSKIMLVERSYIDSNLVA